MIFGLARSHRWGVAAPGPPDQPTAGAALERAQAVADSTVPELPYTYELPRARSRGQSRASSRQSASRPKSRQQFQEMLLSDTNLVMHVIRDAQDELTLHPRLDYDSTRPRSPCWQFSHDQSDPPRGKVMKPADLPGPGSYEIAGSLIQKHGGTLMHPPPPHRELLNAKEVMRGVFVPNTPDPGAYEPKTSWIKPSFNRKLTSRVIAGTTNHREATDSQKQKGLKLFEEIFGFAPPASSSKRHPSSTLGASLEQNGGSMEVLVSEHINKQSQQPTPPPKPPKSAGSSTHSRRANTAHLSHYNYHIHSRDLQSQPQSQVQPQSEVGRATASVLDPAITAGMPPLSRPSTRGTQTTTGHSRSNAIASRPHSRASAASNKSGNNQNRDQNSNSNRELELRAEELKARNEYLSSLIKGVKTNRRKTASPDNSPSSSPNQELDQEQASRRRAQEEEAVMMKETQQLLEALLVSDLTPFEIPAIIAEEDHQIQVQEGEDIANLSTSRPAAELKIGQVESDLSPHFPLPVMLAHNIDVSSQDDDQHKELDRVPENVKDKDLDQHINRGSERHEQHSMIETAEVHSDDNGNDNKQILVQTEPT